MSGTSEQTRFMPQALRPYMCGGLSAMFASFCIHPIDLVKVRLQVAVVDPVTGRKPGAATVARGVLAEGGITKLYAGLSAAVTRQATYGTARLGLHSVFSRKLKERYNTDVLPAHLSFASAFASGAIASAIGNPFDVSLVRMQADGIKPLAERRGYKGVFDAVYRITTEEGFAALYHGYPPTLMRAVAMNVGMMASYDITKAKITAFNGTGMSTDLASAATAGFFCAFLSLPFDMMKTRLQNMKPHAETGIMPYNGVLDCGAKIFRNEGFLAFWTGFPAFYLRCAPHAMIILITREQLFKLWDKFA